MKIYIQNSQLYLYNNSAAKQAEIAGSGTDGTQSTFAGILKEQASQNRVSSPDTLSGDPVDLDEYYSNTPSYEDVTLESATLMLPNAQTIQSIADMRRPG